MEINKTSQHNRYSANLEKTEDKRNWKHTTTSEGITLQGPNLLRRKAIKPNLLTSIETQVYTTNTS